MATPSSIREALAGRRISLESDKAVDACQRLAAQFSLSASEVAELADAALTSTGAGSRVSLAVVEQMSALQAKRRGLRTAPLGHIAAGTPVNLDKKTFSRLPGLSGSTGAGVGGDFDLGSSFESTFSVVTSTFSATPASAPRSSAKRPFAGSSVLDDGLGGPSPIKLGGLGFSPTSKVAGTSASPSSSTASSTATSAGRGVPLSSSSFSPSSSSSASSSSSSSSSSSASSATADGLDGISATERKAAEAWEAAKRWLVSGAPRPKVSHRPVERASARPFVPTPATLFLPGGPPTGTDEGDVVSSLDASGSLRVKVIGRDSALVLRGAGSLTEPVRFMFTTLETRAEAVSDRIDAFAPVLFPGASDAAGASAAAGGGVRGDSHADDEEEKDAADGGESRIVPVNTVSQVPVHAVGRVACDGEGALKLTALLLEGSFFAGGGARVPLNVDDVTDLSLFPGMIAGITGINADGRHLIAQSIAHGSPLPLPRSPVAVLEARATLAAERDSGPLRIWAAAGPYTLSSDLEYMPLVDLFTEAAAARPVPDVLVLVGPFIDAEHEMIKKGRVVFGGPYPRTLRDLWRHLVLTTLTGLMAMPGLEHLRVVLVPSTSDVLGEAVFPQAPFSPEDLIHVSHSSIRDRISLVSNPATFSVGGVVVGVVGTDVLKAINGDSVYRSSTKTERLPRVAEHLLEQQSYFPLHPAPPSVPLDLGLLDHVDMPCTPDILLLPTILNQFVKVSYGSLVVAMGQLTRFGKSGTYMRIEVFPRAPMGVRPAVSETAEHFVAGRTNVEMVYVGGS